MAGSKRLQTRGVCEEKVLTSLAEKFEEASRKVDALIDKIVSADREPKLLYEASRHLIEAGGKRLRPFLTLKSCEVVGGHVGNALPVAAAVELLHTFTLIHDDIMDRDRQRRGRQTVHVKWGVPIAITAGDLLFAKVYESILHYTDLEQVPPNRLLKALDIITNAAIAICEGQANDMMFEEKETISEEEYFKMIGGKTASLLKAAAQTGAIVGGGTNLQVKHVGDFAFYSGLAFQIVDDILGLTADEKALGKTVGSDIREGKRTLIISNALSTADREQRNLILSALGNRKAPTDQIRRVTGIIVELGSIDYAFKKAKMLGEEAKQQLSIFPESPAKTSLLEFNDYLRVRRH